LRDEGISLLFRGTQNVVLEDVSYRISHPQLGEFDLLVSQTCSKRFPNETVYEAILN